MKPLRSALVPLLLAVTPAGAGQALATVFAGPDGRPLPWTTAAEVEGFLREARVVSSERAPGGVTGARKLLLEQADVRAHAVFRTVEETAMIKELGPGHIQYHYRDHYMNEVAAYELSKLLGLDGVPPTVARRIDRRDGSVQLWIENAETEDSFRERSHPPQERARHGLQLDQMRVFDNLIHNIDRNVGNFLTDARGRVWYVDHTRSFMRVGDLPSPELVVRVDRAFFERLGTVSDESVGQALEGHLPAPEVRALLERRRALVALIEQRIEAGAGEVLFDLARARPTPDGSR